MGSHKRCEAKSTVGEDESKVTRSNAELEEANEPLPEEALSEETRAFLKRLDDHVAHAPIGTWGVWPSLG